MIRPSYPIRPVKHLRLRLELATRQTRRTLEKRRRSLLTEMAVSDRSERWKASNGTDVYLLLRWREEVKRQRTIFDAFYDRYDEMICLLCAAAQLGIEPRMEEEYQQRRDWFSGNYAQRVQSLVEPFLAAGAARFEGNEIRFGLWGSRIADSFEALFLPASIAAMLEADGGNLIGRMMHTQEALEAWEAHIARQETAIAESFRFN